MKVSTLREILEGYEDDADVMIAHQPSWPLAETVRCVTTLEEVEEYDEEEGEDDDDEERKVVWIVAGGADYKRSPYAPRSVFESY